MMRTTNGRQAPIQELAPGDTWDAMAISCAWRNAPLWLRYSNEPADLARRQELRDGLDSPQKATRKKASRRMAKYVRHIIELDGVGVRKPSLDLYADARDHVLTAIQGVGGKVLEGELWLCKGLGEWTQRLEEIAAETMPAFVVKVPTEPDLWQGQFPTQAVHVRYYKATNCVDVLRTGVQVLGAESSLMLLRGVLIELEAHAPMEDGVPYAHRKKNRR